MHLTLQDLKTLHTLAIETIKEAGEFIMSTPLDNIKTHEKEAGNTLASSVVTEIDIKSQNIILNKLAPSISKYDLGLLTEESTDDKSRFTKDHFWCVDPLDGTLPFTEGKDGFAVSISLISKQGEAIIGAVLDPTNKITYSAIKDLGVWKNLEPWNLRKPEKKVTLIADRSFLKHKKYNTLTSILKQHSDKPIQKINYAGAVLNAIWVIEEAPAIYLKLPKKENGGGSIWDFASTVCIYNELGLIVSDALGNKVQLNNQESTFMNGCGIIFNSLKQEINISTHNELA